MTVKTLNEMIAFWKQRNLASLRNIELRPTTEVKLNVKLNLKQLKSIYYRNRNVKHLGIKYNCSKCSFKSAFKIHLAFYWFLPTPGEAKAKAMPGRLYTHTKIKCLSICPPATFTEDMSQHTLLIDALRSISPHLASLSYKFHIFGAIKF